MKLTHPEDFNIELGTEVLTHVTLHPEMHGQHLVMSDCGTVGCIAGWTCEFYKGNSWHVADDSRMRAAKIILGLTEDEADRLFAASLSESGARRMLASMIKQATQYHVDIARQAEREEEKRQRAHDRAARGQRWTTWALPGRRQRGARTDTQQTTVRIGQ